MARSAAEVRAVGSGLPERGVRLSSDLGRVMIDLYCERVGAGPWAEPFNTASNAAYLAVAWYLWRGGSPRSTARLLAGLVAAVGVGSSLFHATASPWARVLDETPIALFQVTFLWLYSTRIVGWSRLATAGALAMFAGAVYAGREMPDVLNGSLAYAPALLAASVLAAYHAAAAPRARLALPVAVALFVVAVILRTTDQAVCEAWPIGTHFLWHILTAAALYLFVHGLTVNLARPVSLVLPTG